jgi:hypothetical protein
VLFAGIAVTYSHTRPEPILGRAARFVTKEFPNMQSQTLPETLRRSSRLPFALPILVTSMEPTVHFSEICETLVVNAHGCAVRSPVQLATGVSVHFHSKEGRQTMAHVVDCQPLGTDRHEWMIGARLDHPENFWGVNPCPEDWMKMPQMPAYVDEHASRKPQAKDTKMQRPQTQIEPSLKVVLPKMKEQLSDDRLRSLIAEMVQPLHAEVTNLREKLARPEPKRSQFEVSLSYIPPELEEKLWIRLRQDLGTQVLQQASQQAEQVLGTAKATIEQKLTAAQNEFRQQVKQDLHAVEQRAKSLSESIDGQVNQHLRSGSEQFQQHVFEAGTRLARRSEEYFEELQRRLAEENDARHREIEQVQAAIGVASSRQQALVADLSSRVAKLDEAARHLESDLDARLARMAGEMVAGARAQLEHNAEAILKQMETRSANQLGTQLQEASSRLNMIQEGIEMSASQSLKAQVAQTLQSFEQAMEELAGHAVERWRRSLARDLSSVARILGDEVRMEADSNR